MLVGSLKDVHEFTGILVDVAVLIGAIVAAYEYFKLGRRWTSDLECSHYELPDCYVIFTAYYTLRNTGRRPLHVNKVTIRLTALKEEKTVREKTVLLLADENQKYAERSFSARDGNPAHAGLYYIRPGERAIFPLRVKLDKLEDALSVLCQCELEKGPHPAQYRGFYVKSRPVAAGLRKGLFEESAG